MTEGIRFDPWGKDPAYDTDQQPARRVKITWADTIVPAPVSWAWEDNGRGRIPTGSFSLAAGREGTGKSTFGIWVTAQVTRGNLPGAFHGSAKPVFYVAVEDSWRFTLAPRLIAAGANMSKVGRFDVVNDIGDTVTLTLPSDTSLLERAVVEHGVVLVVVDPLMSVIGERIDTHRTHEVRQALDPLAKLADRTGAVVLGIAHFNKAAGTDAASLLSGSHAFRDVPRSLLGFVRDDTGETTERVMTQVKNSLGRDDLPSLVYDIETSVVDTPAGQAETGKFVFLGESDRTVADILRDARRDPDQVIESRDAASFIKAYLKDAGGTAKAADVLAAGKEAGYKDSTLKHARAKVATSSRDGFGPGSTVYWTLNENTLIGDTQMHRSRGSIPYTYASMGASTAESSTPTGCAVAPISGEENRTGQRAEGVSSLGLAHHPGRCPVCEWHTPTQGHAPSCTQDGTR